MTYLKKIFSAVLCMILLCGYTAFAQESEKYDIETTATVLNNIVTVNISIEAENESTCIFIRLSVYKATLTFI